MASSDLRTYIPKTGSTPRLITEPLPIRTVAGADAASDRFRLDARDSAALLASLVLSRQTASALVTGLGNSLAVDLHPAPAPAPAPTPTPQPEPTPPPVPAPSPIFGTALPKPLVVTAGRAKIVTVNDDWKSAIANALSGETIKLRGGDYGALDPTELVIPTQGNALAPITITNYPGEQVNIRQFPVVNGAYLRFLGLRFTRNAYTTDDRPGATPPQSAALGNLPGGNMGLWTRSSQHVTVEHCEIDHNTMSGFFGGGSFGQLLYSHLHHNGTTSDDHGVYWVGPDGLIAGCLVDGNFSFGIQLGYGATRRTIVTANTIIATSLKKPLVAFGGTGGNTFCYNNLAGPNGPYTDYDGTNLWPGNIWSPTGEFDPTTYAPLRAALSGADPAYLPPFLHDGSPRARASAGAF